MNTTASSTNASRQRSSVDEAVSDFARRSRIPSLSLAVVSSTGVIHAGSVGHADLATWRPATPATPYLWFSLTKIATATAAMALADRGVIDIEAPVSAYLPSTAAIGHLGDATVVQLLSHTAGLANPLPIRWIRPADAPPADPAEFLQRMLRKRGIAARRPGGPARYSNVGFLVLAEVLASVAARPFTELLRDEVLEPLGMTRTGFAHQPDTATGYVRAPRPVGALLEAYLPRGTVGGRHASRVALRPFLVQGAGYGGLVSDVVDAARLAQLHLADGSVDGVRILEPATARRMRTVASPGRPFDLGLGWFRNPANASEIAHVEHLGAGGGYYNAMRIYPELDLGFVAMANTTTPYDHHQLFENLRTLEWSA